MVPAAGIKKTVEPLHWGEAITLAGGVAACQLEHAALPGQPHRVGPAPVVLATIPLGHVLAV
ncbi:low temperature requirement protein A, partial [Actinoplanes sp. NPDC049599]